MSSSNPGISLRLAGTLSRILRLEPADGWRLALIVAIAFAVRLAWTLATQQPPGSDAAVYDGLAWRLASGEGYVNPDGTPHVFLPVGWPAFLAAVYVVFGHSWTAAGVANAMLGALSVVLAYRLAREALSPRLSLVATAAFALTPSHVISFVSVLRYETFYTNFVLLALILTCRLARCPTWRNAALLGLVIGVGAYVRPVMLPFAAVVLVMLWPRVGGKRSLILACVVGAASLLAIAPYTARNYLELGVLVPISTNTADVMYNGSGPGATGELRDYRGYLPDGFDELSEAQKYRELQRLALRHVYENPGEWLALLPIKFFHLWASDRYNMDPRIFPAGWRPAVPLLWVIAQAYWTLIALAAAAAFFTRPLRSYWLTFPGVLFPLTLIYWTAVHMVGNGEGRYHIPVTPVVIIIAAHALERLPNVTLPWPRKRATLTN